MRRHASKWHSRRVPIGLRRAASPPLALRLLAVAVPLASAHPLGNFTVNQYTRLDIARQDVSVRYVLDMAEIPTFQRRQIVDADHDGRISAAEAALESKRLVAIVAPHLHLTADGRPVRLALETARVAFPHGQGGLSTTRLDARFRAVGADARRLAAHVRALQQLRDRPRRLARAARRARPRRRGALDRRVRQRPHEGAHALPDRPAALAARRALRDDGRGARLGRSRRPGHPRARCVRARAGLELGQERRRVRLADRDRRAPDAARRARGARARARVRHVPRAHAGARQDDGRGLPRGHARPGAARADPRRDRHDHAHRRRLRARHRDALALAVHRPRPALPVAQPGLRRDGRRHRRVRDPRPPASAGCGRRPPAPRRRR